MHLDGLPGIRLLKVNAAITYLKVIKKARKALIFLIGISLASLLICVGLLLIGLSFLREFTLGVFLFGAGIILIAAIVMGFLLSQRVWMRIFEIDQLIEHIKKGATK